jgi:hypothetical protein
MERGLFKIPAGFKKTATLDEYIGDAGELFYNDTDPRLRISDGRTPGGIAVTVTGLENIRTHVTPADHGNLNLGSSQNSWKNMYIANGSIWIDNAEIATTPDKNAIVLPSGTKIKGPNGQLQNLAEAIESAVNITLSQINDVDTSNVEEGSLLQYNGRANVWEAKNNIDTAYGTLRLNGGAY